jgi:hypothetical protein
LQLSHSREVRFNIGQYEHMVSTVGITVDTDELGLRPQQVDEAIEFMDNVLDSAQQVDIDRADAISLTPEDVTTIHLWKDNL